MRLLILAALGLTTLTGCLPTCGGGGCPPGEDLIEGNYKGQLEDGTAIDAIVARTAFIATYTDADGNTWRVQYTAVDAE